MILRIFALVALTLSLAAQAAWACSCASPPPAKEALAKAHAVFLGKVTDVKKADFDVAVTLEVTSAWKGVKEKSVVVHTASAGSLCGYGFEVGKSYVIYAYQSGEEGAAERPLSTNICTRTRLFDGKDKSEIEALGEPIKMLEPADK